MRRINRYCLMRQQIKMSWNPINCFNILQRKPLNERNLNLFQLQWKSKSLCRLYFNGDVTERIFKQTFRKQNRNFADTLAFMERRLDNFLFRCMFVSSVYLGRRVASSGMVTVNGKTVSRPGYILEEGDMIQIKSESGQYIVRQANHPFIRLWSFLPAYADVNFPTLSAVLLRKPRFEEIPSPFPRYLIDTAAGFYSKHA